MAAGVLPPESLYRRRCRQLAVLALVRECAEQAGIADVEADAVTLAGALMADLAEAAKRSGQ